MAQVQLGRIAIGLDKGASSFINFIVSDSLPDISSRGMPRWREKQRNLPVGQKVELLGRIILETRRLEAVKKQWKPSATSSNPS